MVLPKMTFTIGGMPATASVVSYFFRAEEQRIVLALTADARRVAQAMTQWAKDNHPWRNVTGAAEAGLTPFVSVIGGRRFEVGVQHGVSYGVFLEERFGGRWGVLRLVQQRFASEAASMFKG